jgi:hypothetical protein
VIIREAHVAKFLLSIFEADIAYIVLLNHFNLFMVLAPFSRLKSHDLFIVIHIFFAFGVWWTSWFSIRCQVRYVNCYRLLYIHSFSMWRCECSHWEKLLMQIDRSTWVIIRFQYLRLQVAGLVIIISKVNAKIVLTHLRQRRMWLILFFLNDWSCRRSVYWKWSGTCCADFFLLFIFFRSIVVQELP